MKSFLKTSGYILLYLLIYMVVQVKLLMGVGIIMAFQGYGRDELLKYAVPVLLPSALLSLVLYWLILRSRKINIVKYCNFKKVKLLNIILIIVMVIGISVVIEVALSYVVSFFPSYNDTQDVIAKGTTNFFGILCVTFLIPLFEEILFRGIILNDLRNKINVTLAVLIQGILFGVYHMNVVQSTYAAIIGIFFGFACVWTESIISSMTAHITFNLFGVIIMPAVLAYVGQSYVIMAALAGLVIFVAAFMLLYKNTHRKNVEIKLTV